MNTIRGRQYFIESGRVGSSYAKARGSTLIEVLVALLLLSFTLLGIAGLMSATTRYQLGVDTRSVITLLFNDLTSRVRINNQAAAGAYNYSASWSTQQSGPGSAPSPACGSGTDCSPAERAAYDIWEVRDTIRDSMPQGSLLITGDPNDGMIMSLLWFDKDFLSDASTLRQSPLCATSMTAIQLQSCCPSAAGVSSTPGVRCLNYSFIR